MKKIMFPHLTFVVDHTINLINGSHYECERKEHQYPRVPKNLSLIRHPIIGLAFF